MSLVRWLNQHTNTVEGLIYYFENNSKDNRYHSGILYKFNWDTNELIQEIKQYGDTTAQQLAIAKRNDRGENAFHFVFEKLFMYYGNEHTILKADEPKVIKPYFENYVIRQYDDLGVQNRKYKEHPEVLANHAFLFQNNLVKPTYQRVDESMSEIIKVLFVPFQNDEKALVEVLLAKDKKKLSTPLFCAMKSSKKYPKEFLEGMKWLSPENKEKLLLKQNENGKTAMHVRLTTWGEITQHDKEIFGEETLKKALSQQDDEHNTPLHDVLLKTQEPLPILDSIGILFKSQPLKAESKEEANPVKKLFCKNIENLNPFHLVCQRDAKNPNTNLSMFNALLNMLPENLHAEKLMEPDGKGCTPLHYAIENRHYNIAAAILTRLNAQDRKKLIMAKNNKHFNAVHYACGYGNRDIIERLLSNLGPAEIYDVRYGSPDLLKLVVNNSDQVTKADMEDLLKETKVYNKLFDCFHYLQEMHMNKKDFSKRLDDFCACFIAIKNKAALPVEDPEFITKSRRQRYHSVRSALENVTDIEIQAFEEFIEKMAGLSQKENFVTVAKLIHEKIKPVKQDEQLDQPIGPVKASAPLALNPNPLVNCFEYLEKLYETRDVNFSKHLNDFYACLQLIKNESALMLKDNYFTARVYMPGLFKAQNFNVQNTTAANVAEFEGWIEKNSSSVANFLRDKMAMGQLNAQRAFIPVALPVARRS